MNFYIPIRVSIRIDIYHIFRKTWKIRFLTFMIIDYLDIGRKSNWQNSTNLLIGKHFNQKKNWHYKFFLCVWKKLYIILLSYDSYLYCIECTVTYILDHYLVYYFLFCWLVPIYAQCYFFSIFTITIFDWLPLSVDDDDMSAFIKWIRAARKWLLWPK